jgi:chromosome segregation ATPase
MSKYSELENKYNNIKFNNEKLTENEHQMTNDLTLAISELEKVLSFKTGLEENIKSLTKDNHLLNEKVDITRNKNISLEKTQKKMSSEINEYKDNIQNINEKQNELLRMNEELKKESYYSKNINDELSSKLTKLNHENIHKEKLIRR